MDMQFTHLGHTGLRVSRLCLGTMNFGWVADEAESFAVMDKALELGVNFFDTADVYGHWSTHAGACEELIGRWLAQGEGRREAIVLASKVYNPMDREGLRPEPNRDVRSLSKLKIIRHCEDSLARLGVEAIDLYQLHHIDRHCPFDEMWEALEVLQRQGKVIYVGSSNYAGWDIATANMAAKARHNLGLVSEQSLYNLISRMVELEVNPACRHFGMGLLPWSPLAGGMLSGILQKQKEGRSASEDLQKEVEKHRSKLEPYEAFCRELGHAPASVALAWLLHNPVVASPIIGPRTVAQLESSLPALEVQLDQAALDRLDAIFPGPGGEAPNAYAW